MTKIAVGDLPRSTISTLKTGGFLLRLDQSKPDEFFAPLIQAIMLGIVIGQLCRRSWDKVPPIGSALASLSILFRPGVERRSFIWMSYLVPQFAAQ